MPNIIKLIIIFSRVKKPFPSSAREPKKHVLCSSTKRKAKCHVVNVTTEVAGPSMRWNWPELLPDTAVTVSPEHLEPFQKWQLKVISRVIKIGKHTKSSLFWYWAGAEERDRACHVRRNQFIAVEKEEERERERERKREAEGESCWSNSTWYSAMEKPATATAAATVRWHWESVHLHSNRDQANATFTPILTFISIFSYIPTCLPIFIHLHFYPFLPT